MFWSRLCLFVSLVVPLSACAATKTLLVLGDSLSAAYGLPAQNGWVSLLEARLAQRKPAWRVVNASISGETSQGGAYRIGKLLAEHKPALVIVELGANDGLRGLPLETTRASLDAILAACRKSNARAVLVGMRLPPNYGTEYTRKFRELYPDLARQRHAVLAPFLLEGIADDRTLFQADGLHPTAAAQPRLLENVWQTLAPLL